MSISKAQEAGLAAPDDDDNASLASSFVSVRRASPVPSISTTAPEHEDLTDNPPAYAGLAPQPAKESTWANQDPRANSTESLGNTTSAQDSRRRRILLVYIHGFLGNETSFQGFPAHVHNLLSILLSESHVVHTKIYPRYRTKKALRLAAEDFSKWLAPHHDSKTDVVLLGHSMGGFVAADVALLRDPRGRNLKHQLLGTISFDSPFLGVHPGMVWSGITSLFRPAPSPPKSPQPGEILQPDTLTQTPTPDQHYNPSFANDIHLPIRTGWANTLHFVNKHSKTLHKATKKLATSHLEFGGELADGRALKRRYWMVKALDNEDDSTRAQVVEGHSHPKRTRFANYYTACSGRSKKVKEAGQSSDGKGHSEVYDAREAGLSVHGQSDSGALSLDTHDSVVAPTSTSPTLVDQDSVSVATISTTDVETPDSEMGSNFIGEVTSPTSPTSPGSRLGLRSQSLSPSFLRAPSPAPSNATLPSYTTEAPVWTPAPRYPVSSRSSYMASPTGLTPKESASSVSSSSLSLSEDQLEPPTPLGPPPLPSDYPNNKTAYATALKGYLQESKQYAHAVKRFHKMKAKQRLAGIRSDLEHKKAAQAAHAEERALELQIREEERRRISEAPTPEARLIEIEVMRERRMREMELRRDQLKSQSQSSEARHPCRMERQMTKSEWHDARKQLRKEHQANRKNMKEEIKATRFVIKEQQKVAKGLRKSRQKGQSSDDPSDLTEVLSSTGDMVQEPEDIDTERGATPSSRVSTLPPSTLTSEKSQNTTSARELPETKKQKDKKFCILPPKDATGERDPSWQRVYLEDVDEVGAHCGIFFPQGATGAEAIDGQAWGERYARLVADVAERMETWAHDEMTERLVRESEGL